MLSNIILMYTQTGRKKLLQKIKKKHSLSTPSSSQHPGPCSLGPNGDALSIVGMRITATVLLIDRRHVPKSSLAQHVLPYHSDAERYHHPKQLFLVHVFTRLHLQAQHKHCQVKVKCWSIPAFFLTVFYWETAKCSMKNSSALFQTIVCLNDFLNVPDALLPYVTKQTSYWCFYCYTWHFTGYSVSTRASVEQPATTKCVHTILDSPSFMKG